MNILNIIQCTKLGGMEKANLLLLQELIKRKHSVQLVSLNPLGDLKPLLDKSNIPSEGLNYRGPFGFGSLARIHKTIRKYSPYSDSLLITGHNAVAMLAAMPFNFQRKVLSLHYHHYENGNKRWHWPYVYKLADDIFDSIVFSSKFIYKEAINIRPHIDSKSYPLGNPFILPPTPSKGERENARKALNLPSDRLIVGNAGWLIKRKRFDIFVDVAANTLKTRPEVLFLIAGDGPEKYILKELIKERNISKNIKIIDWQDNIDNFYKSIDILLFNSDFDALGRTPLEAASFGVPVVSSVVCGGLKEVFDNSECGLLLNEHDVSQLANSVIELLSDDQLRKAKGLAARKKVELYGSVDNYVSQFEKLLIA